MVGEGKGREGKGEYGPPNANSWIRPCKMVLDLPTPEVWKAELT